jgi:hypothetical protein
MKRSSITSEPEKDLWCVINYAALHIIPLFMMPAVLNLNYNKGLACPMALILF